MNVRNRVLLSALNEEEKRYEENSNLYNGSSIKYGTNDSPRSSNIQIGGMKSIIGGYSKEPSSKDDDDNSDDDDYDDDEIELQDVGVSPSEVTTIHLLENKLR